MELEFHSIDLVHTKQATQIHIDLKFYFENLLFQILVLMKMVTNKIHWIFVLKMEM